MIYLVRHGETINNVNKIVQGHSDVSLSSYGKIRIHELGIVLKNTGIKFDSFYSSPLSRAKETLEIIMDELNVDSKIIIEEDLIERDFGEAEGIDYSIPDNTWKITNDYFPSMEKNNVLEKRIYSCILKIAKDNINKNVLIVSHSHVIKAFIRNIIKDYSYSEISYNLNINIFDFDGSSFKPIEINKDLI